MNYIEKNTLKREYDRREKSREYWGKRVMYTNKEKIQRTQIANKHNEIKSICNEKIH